MKNIHSENIIAIVFNLEMLYLHYLFIMLAMLLFVVCIYKQHMIIILEDFLKKSTRGYKYSNDVLIKSVTIISQNNGLMHCFCTHKYSWIDYIMWLKNNVDNSVSPG